MKVSRIIFIFGLAITLMGGVLCLVSPIGIGVTAAIFGIAILETAQYLQCSDIDKEL